MKEFSELALQKLNENGEYYVYGLIDPRNNKLFYIGKGTGNRVFQHVAESDKNPESLTNIVAGHHSCGCLTVEEIEQKYGAELLKPEDFKHKILIIKINKLYDRDMNSQNLYDIVRGKKVH